jgi:Trp operon repressor
MSWNKLIYLLLLSFGITYAQFPTIDPTFRSHMIKQKAIHYNQMIQNELQKTANQEDYDVTYYSLDLTPDPATSLLESIVEIVGEVISPTLDRVELNFWDGMSITDIHRSSAPGIQLQYSRNNDILTVHLDRVYRQGEQFRIAVVYNGRPGDSEYRSFNFDTFNNEPMIWTMSSVFRARGWWPCKDVPSDKPDSMDIRVTVPGNLIVASNGSLRQKTTTGNQTTYWWHEKYPIATYLVSVSIHPYEMHYDDYIYDNGSRTMEIQFYSFPGNYEANIRINNLVGDMLSCYSELFGEYPFVDEKYAQVDFLWGGGMEHQTCTSYGSWNEGLFAHEIAHQWWGDMITCDSFHHIWLNEGFASYSEALWFEYAYPPFTASEYQMMYQLYLGPGTVFVEDPQTENIFDSGLSYVKGSWILHMLRHVVGDVDFFNILKAYNNSPEHKYGTATTEGFQDVCEQISGIDLDKFFYQWIYEEYFPEYSYSWNWVQNESGYNINLEIRQEQTNHIFWMPIDVTITTSGGETTFVVWDSLAMQSFNFPVSSEPTNLELDKNNWVLKQIPEDFVNPTFDRGILLVNGVLFDNYGEEIRNSYENRAFWSDFQISFWDCFTMPRDGYPSTLPEPLGYGKVPGDVLGQFSSVIWIGNNYGGDLGSWQQTSILPYLESGGNLLLMTRRGQDFFDNELRDYLGITWAENPHSTINNCISIFSSGLTDISLTGHQSYNAVFDTELTSNESRLLFHETVSCGIPRGLGVWHKPAAEGTYRSDGGNFVFISGRPYRYDSNQLKSNIKYILQNFFNESSSPGLDSTESNLYQNSPNPFKLTTTINYYLPEDTKVVLRIYNLLGQTIKTLVNNDQFSGNKSVIWNGTDDSEKIVSSGIYIYSLQTGNTNSARQSKKMLFLK